MVYNIFRYAPGVCEGDLNDHPKNFKYGGNVMNKKISHVTDGSWDSEVLGHDGLVMVDFWAEWCGPCRMIAPVLDQISEEVDDVKVCKLNVDQNPGTARKYDITGIPTMIFFKDGKPVDQVIGFTNKGNIEDVIQRNL